MSWKLIAILFFGGAIAVRVFRARVWPMFPAVQPTPHVVPVPGLSVAGLSTPELALVLAARIKADEATAVQRAEADALVKSLAEALKPKPSEVPKL